MEIICKIILFYSQFPVEDKSTKQNLRVLIRFILILTAMVTVYNVLFHSIMAWEERQYRTGRCPVDLSTLTKAWIEKTPSALVTATNIYLTKYSRSLRPDLQIISRANLDRTLSTLHHAGEDFVMSYPVLGVNAVFSFLMKQDVLNVD